MKDHHPELLHAEKLAAIAMTARSMQARLEGRLLGDAPSRRDLGLIEAEWLYAAACAAAADGNLAAAGRLLRQATKQYDSARVS